MLEVDGAWCPPCATSGFSLYKAPSELKEFVLLSYPLRSESNSDFLLDHKSSVDIT